MDAGLADKDGEGVRRAVVVEELGGALVDDLDALARVRADYEARLAREREGLKARLSAVQAERDRLVAQVAREAEERARLGRIAEVAKARAAALTEELTTLRGERKG